MGIAAAGHVGEVVSRPGAARRWLIVAAGVVVLVLAPVVVAAWPVSAQAPSMPVLLSRVQGSATVAYQGNAETVGRLNLPDLGIFESVTSLFSDRTRMRVWYASPTSYRVDTLGLASERGYYRTGNRLWAWDSDLQTATLVHGVSRTRLPTPPDVLPPELGRRVLAGVPAGAVRRGGDARVAGRACIGLTVPADDPRSSIDHVAVCVDPATAVPLAVRIVPRTDPGAAFDSRFLDFDPTAPSAADVHFDPTGAQVIDIPEQGDLPIPPPGTPVRLPRTLAGLPQRSDAGTGVATYGRRYALLAVAPVDPALVAAVRSELDSPSRPPVRGKFGEASIVETPLVNALAVADTKTGWLLAGTVTADVLKQVAAELVNGPYGFTARHQQPVPSAAPASARGVRQ
ncbi:MAG: hypothetical protein ACXV5Q_07695 [Frankiaceae bacterium]